MNVLVGHNYYQNPGGEDQVFLDETELLEDNGHKVIRHIAHNDNVIQYNLPRLGAKTVFNREKYKELMELMRDEKIDVAHFHNTLPLISPAAYFAANKLGIPVVQTLHNYRLTCPGALFFRNEQVCEDCLGKTFAWPGVVHKCYRESRMTTAAVAGMVAVHKLAGTWSKRVNQYIALTDFAQSKFIESGLPADKVSVKPNFVSSRPEVGQGDGDYALFVGRLAAGKGMFTILWAWRDYFPGLKLRVIGDGPLSPGIEQSNIPDVEWLGRLPMEDVYTHMSKAKVVIVPSEWYETFGRVVVEAFSVGTPVIASGLGAIKELVDEGRTGFLFEPSNSKDLSDKVKAALSDTDRLAKMRLEVRKEYEARYTPERNYQQLMTIYEKAAADARK